MTAIERATAAVCRAHGWHAQSVIGHREWQVGKVDPRGFSMDGMRDRIARRLDSSPSGPRYERFPGADWFHTEPHSPIVTAMGRRLVAEGCSAYEIGPGPQWTDADRRSYAAWQRKLGYSGADADGWPGHTSWTALHVPAAS